QAGKQIARFSYRVDAPGTDNALIQFGRSQTVLATGQEAYIATLAWGKATLPGSTNAVAVGANIGNWEVTGTSGTSYAIRSFNIELDKIDVHKSSVDPVTFASMGALRIRSAVPDAGVTISDLIGLSFVGPQGLGGTVTTYKAIEIPYMNSNSYVGTYYGIWFE